MKMVKRKSRLIMYNVLLVIIVVALIGLYAGKVYLMDEPVSSSGGSQGQVQQVVLYPATPEDFKRLEDMLPGNEIIQKLPDNAKLQLSFYNFNSGSRIWDGDYILTKGNAEKGVADDADIKLIMHSRWLSILNANNFCQVIKSSKANGDFYSELMLSKIKLGWKYKSIMSYKSCLGL